MLGMRDEVKPVGVTAPVEVVRPGRMRVDTVDVVRGLVMVLMALDHVRDFWCNANFNPVDPNETTIPYFFTRWVTHFCAATFVFLAGTSAYLSAARGKTRPQLAMFLVTRGLWIICLELTVVWCLGWTFNFTYHHVMVGVLWAIGWSMIVLGVLVFLPTWAITLIGVVMIAGHNAFDDVRPESWGSLAWLWRVLHTGGPIFVSPDFTFFVGYPLVPWIGVMAAGFGLGAVMRMEPGRRRACLLALGLALTLAFGALRGLNEYGDPHPWSQRPEPGKGLDEPWYSICSFLNCHKYPPSLLYLLMTLGPSLLAMAFFDRELGPVGRRLATFGRVPMFYYLLHLPLIHGLALIVAMVRYGEEFDPEKHLTTYGYGLPMVYLVWVAVILILYPLCAWLADIKRRRRDVWLSYF
jgi:uncharacterized membrane protein